MSCLLELVKDLRMPEHSGTILKERLTLEYQQSLEIFSSTAIIKILEGLTTYSRERSYTDDQFKTIIRIIDDNAGMLFSSEQQFQLVASALLGQICENLPGYSNASTAPLTILWNLVNAYDLDCMIVAKAGMAIFTKAGTGITDQIIDTLLALDISSISGDEENFARAIIPFGKFLKENPEYLIKPEVCDFLNTLSSRLTEGIYSEDTIQIDSFDISNGKLIGVTAGESKHFVFLNRLKQPPAPQCVHIQILYDTYTNDDEYKHTVYCRFLGFCDKQQPTENSHDEKSDSDIQKSFLELSQDEMWGFLQRIQFHEVSAAQLFGEYLLDELKKGNLDISGGKIWKRWRQKHFVNLSGIDAIKKISHGKWVPLQLNSGNDITVRKVSNTSTDIERAKERIQVLLQQRKVRRPNLRITSPDSKRSNRMERRANLSKVRVSIHGRNRKTAKKLSTSFKPKTEEE